MTNKSKNTRKLTKAQREGIKELLLDESRPKQEWIARKFGVAQCTIAHYKRQLEEELLNVVK